MSPAFEQRLTVLLVEDQLPEVDLVREMLSGVSSVRFDLLHVARLQDALERLQRGGIDVVLLDLCLPDSHGYATFECVQKEAPQLPIILMTNLDDEALAARAVRQGAQDYLIKRRVERDLLVRSIRYAIERQRAEEALRASEERYALAVQGANDGLWDWDITTGSVYYSDRWLEIIGFPAGDFPPHIDAWLERIHPSDSIEFRRGLDAHLSGDSDHFAHEYRIRKQSTEYVWVLTRGVAVFGKGRKPLRMAGSLSDVSQRKQAEARLVHDALHDALTGLPNRALLLDHMELAMQKLRDRDPKVCAVLLLDLDRFKNVTESLGHAFGDRLLQDFATRLLALMRPGDTVARLGGDEFAVLLPDVDHLGQVIGLADRVLAACTGTSEIDGCEAYTSVSIGIAMADHSYSAAETLLRDADIALYRAKSSGRARYQVFDRAMHRNVVYLQKLESDLQRAVEENEFVMHYQPIFSLEQERLVGMEALVRWNHPRRGLVGPDDFIYAAEETGLIVPLGWWTLRESCRQALQWQQEFPNECPLSISVNISGKLFNQPDIVSGLTRILADTGLPAESLRLELTESVLLDHAEEAMRKLTKLHALGVGLSVDDFGTGYSSLSYLQKFDYDSLKIDRSFVSDIDRSNGSIAIVQTIIGLGRMLGMNIIAEGVETQQQLHRLRELRCPQVQGYWFAKPMDSDAVARMLAERPLWLPSRTV